MSENTKIEWTDSSWNGWEGCTAISPGCDFCYAKDHNSRFNGGAAINWGPGAPRRRTSVANWRKPRAWNAAADAFLIEHGRRRRVFVSSLADVFDNEVDPQWRVDLLQLISETPNIDWLILTKRIGNAAGMLDEAVLALTNGQQRWADAPFPNVWLGDTVVNQVEADRDIEKLLKTPALLHFLSMEPLLGPVDISHWLVPTNDRPKVRWVIAGGESGPRARPHHPQWSLDLRDQCAAANVAFLFKQWGEWSPDDPGEHRSRDTAAILPTGDFRLSSEGYVAPFDSADRLAGAAGVRLDGRTLMHKLGKTRAGRVLAGNVHDSFPVVSL